MHQHRTAQHNAAQLEAHADIAAGRASLARLIDELQVIERDIAAAIEAGDMRRAHGAALRADALDLGDAVSPILVGSERCASDQQVRFVAA